MTSTIAASRLAMIVRPRVQKLAAFGTGVFGSGMEPAHNLRRPPECSTSRGLWRLLPLLLCAFAWNHTLANSAQGQDSVEFLNGSVLEGKILEIRKADRQFDFQSKFGAQWIQRTYRYDQVHAVVLKGRRFVLTPKSSKQEESGDSPGEISRTREEVLEIINDEGQSDPQWLSTTALNYPKSLDLDWPLKPPPPWNESKNVGQFIWGRVNPNVSRWKSGIKLVLECMDRHTGNRALLQRDMEKLGTMYFTLLQDYPRAAHWFRKSGSKSAIAKVHLAECYWRLGNREMALQTIRQSPVHFHTIKLLGDMGEIDWALRLTGQLSEYAFHESHLNAGDALRGAGRLEEAIQHYQMVLDETQARNEQYRRRYHGRAQDSIDAIRLSDKADVNKVADGTYEATSIGYNGELKVAVSIRQAKITDVKVIEHKEKQFYAALTDTPRQILDTQGVQEIDGTSGATITSQAIVNATARAMAKGAK